MCQLLGMNCNVPTDICFSFTGFQTRGGATDHHTDGWGIAFFEGKGVRQFLDVSPSCTSPVAEFVKNYPLKSKSVIAHIRKATQGSVSLENTHPFQRELWGRYWVFAHNGNLPDFSPKLKHHFVPVGSTDSEKIFCWILQELKDEFGDAYPGDQKLFDAVQRITKPLASLGELNFLFSSGEFLIAHCSTRLSFIVRKAPFLEATLKDKDVTVNFQSLTTLNDRVAIIATIPLTQNENWTTVNPGTLLMFQEGELISTSETNAWVKPADCAKI